MIGHGECQTGFFSINEGPNLENDRISLNEFLPIIDQIRKRRRFNDISIDIIVDTCGAGNWVKEARKVKIECNVYSTVEGT